MKSVPLGADLNSVEFRLCLLEVIQSSLSSAWAGVRVEDLDVNGVDSSLTNQLCIVRSNGRAAEHDSVIIRIFGENTDEIIDRESERHLNESLTKIAFDCPAFLGYFSNGRIESFIDGKSCDAEDFASPINGPLIASSLAPLLGKLHSAVTPTFTLEKEHTISRLRGFVSLAEKVSFPAGHEKATKLERAELESMKSMIQRVVGEIEALEKEQSGRPIHAIATQNAIIHGDLLCGNILVDNAMSLASASESAATEKDAAQKPKLQLKLWLIDMEYSGVGAPAYDIANHFNEWLGYDVDNALYPSKETRYSFYKDYLDARAACVSGSDANHHGATSRDVWLPWTQSRGNCGMDGGNDEEMQNQFLSQFDEIVILYGLLSHLYWAVWSVTLSVKEQSAFDYLEYARLKFRACLELEKVRK